MALPLRDILGIPRGRKALVATSTVLEAAQDRTLNLNTKLAVSAQVRASWMQFQTADYGYLYGHQPAVRAVVDYIAQNVVELGPKLYRRKGDMERKEVGDHEAAETLRDPNPWTPGRQLIFDAFADFLVYNNAYVLKLRPPGSPRMYLLSVPASAVGVLGNGVYQLAGYQIFRSDGSNFTVPPADMIHWRGYDASDRRVGISKLETLRADLSEQAASQRANVDLMESGLQQRGYIKRPLEAPDWRKDGGKDRFVEQFRAAMQKASRGYPVLEEGMEIAPLGVSPKDAEMLDSRRLFNDEVARQFGMTACPPEGEDQRRQFYADVLPPLCSLFCDHLRLQYLQAEFMEDDLYFEFSLDKKQMSDNRLQALTSAAGVPPLLRNEVRAMLNLGPVEGGDQPVTPANILSGIKPSTGVMPIQSPTGPSQTGEFRPGEEQLPPPAKAIERKYEEKKFDPRQPRDSHGRWTETPGWEPDVGDIRGPDDAFGMAQAHPEWVRGPAFRPGPDEWAEGTERDYEGWASPPTEAEMQGRDDLPNDDETAIQILRSEINQLTNQMNVFALDDPKRERLREQIEQRRKLIARRQVGERSLEGKKRFNPNQPRDPHTGQWIDTPGGPAMRLFPAAPAQEDPAWHPPRWSSDTQWEEAGEAEWLRAPRHQEAPPPTESELLAEARTGQGVNMPGRVGEVARAEHARQGRRDEEANRRALVGRNPDMNVSVIAGGGGFELKPKPGSNKSPEELHRDNPDYDGPRAAKTAFGRWLKSHGFGDSNMSEEEYNRALDEFAKAQAAAPPDYHSTEAVAEAAARKIDEAINTATNFLHRHRHHRRRGRVKRGIERWLSQPSTVAGEPGPTHPWMGIDTPFTNPKALDDDLRKKIEVTNAPRFRADVARQRRNIVEATSVLEAFYGRQQRSLEKKALQGKAFDTRRWNRELAQDLGALLKAIIGREGDIYVARLGGAEFDMGQVENYIKATAVKLAERINHATQRDLEEGTAVDALERAQQERAEVAGAGIGTKSTIFARREAAKQSPEPERRTQIWVKHTDRHAEFDGKSVALDEDWGGIEPGSEPGCQCSAVIQ